MSPPASSPSWCRAGRSPSPIPTWWPEWRPRCTPPTRPSDRSVAIATARLLSLCSPPERSPMSSHREAPEISKDPAADNTDVYAFVSPEAPDTVTLIANFNPFETPYGGPNFHEFADDVVYTINISNTGGAHADISYEFRFDTTIRNPKTFLYNTGPITSIDSPNW